MAYCPKCGVEVSSKIKNCPLCTFPIPDIGTTEEQIEEEHFPVTVNIYPQRIKEIVNIIYFAISIISFAAVLICYTIANAFDQKGNWLDYAVIGIIGGWAMVFALYKFTKGFIKGILGCSIVALSISFFIDKVDGTMTWFTQMAVPITISFIAITLILHIIFIKLRQQVEFFTLAVYLCAGLGLFSLGLQLSISKFVFGSYTLDWSIIIIILMAAVIALLLGLRYKLPNFIKEKLKRTFHI